MLTHCMPVIIANHLMDYSCVAGIEILKVSALVQFLVVAGKGTARFYFILRSSGLQHSLLYVSMLYPERNSGFQSWYLRSALYLSSPILYVSLTLTHIDFGLKVTMFQYVVVANVLTYIPNVSCISTLSGNPLVQFGYVVQG